MRGHGDERRAVRHGEPRELDRVREIDRSVVDAGEEVEVELCALHGLLLP